MTPSRLFSFVDPVNALIREAAASLIMPRFRSLSVGDIDTKSSPTDLVTVADREAEAWLVPRLCDLLPGSVAVGEEAVSADPETLSHLSEDAPVWIIDPVDGTRNFVEGRETFGVMVALAQRQQTLAGWIFAPVEDMMAVAVRGEGATLNGTTLAPRPSRDFSSAKGDYSSRYLPAALRPAYDAAFSQTAGYRQGHCSAFLYLDIARGHLEYGMQYLMSPWDHAPGTLLVEEAGGACRFTDREGPYTPISRAPRPLLCTGAEVDWQPYRCHLPDGA